MGGVEVENVNRSAPAPAGLRLSHQVTAEMPLELAEQPDVSPLVFERVATPSLVAPTAAAAVRHATVAADISTSRVIGAALDGWIPQFAPSKKEQ